MRYPMLLQEAGEQSIQSINQRLNIKFACPNTQITAAYFI